jgi:hypothetical protein
MNIQFGQKLFEKIFLLQFRTNCSPTKNYSSILVHI